MSGGLASPASTPELTGVAAPPRRNGELVFSAPWHSRAFGMVVGLHRAGAFEWEEFRQRLIARIGAWDQQHETTAHYDYYTHWLGALQDLLVAKNLADAAAIADLTRALASRSPESDHDHPHEH